jgi:hypothetical protein
LLLVWLVLTPAPVLAQPLGPPGPPPASEGPPPEEAAPPPIDAPEVGEPPATEAAPVAAPAEAQPAPPPQIYIQQPMPPPPEPRRRMYHDGFYLRMTVGGGLLSTRSSVSDTVDTSDARLSVDGAGYLFDFGIGGSPAPGLVVGGAILVQDAWSPRVRYRGPTGFALERTGPVSESLWFALVGPMVDAFPDPDGGLHVGGTLGIAVLGLEDDAGNASTGLGAAAWVGYLWWVSSEWSIGATLRMAFAGTGRELPDGDATDITRSLGLGFTALYH